MFPGEAVVLGGLFGWARLRQYRARRCGRRVYVYSVGELRCTRTRGHVGRHVASRRGVRAVSW